MRERSGRAGLLAERPRNTNTNIGASRTRPLSNKTTSLLFFLSAFLFFLLSVSVYYASLPSEFEYELLRGHFLGRSGNRPPPEHLQETPLHVAAEEGHTEEVISLLSIYDVNTQDESFNTPLHRASATIHTEPAKVLLEHGADPNIQNIAERTPLHYAIQFGSVDVVELLIDHGADVNLMAHDLSPLYIAVSIHNHQIVKKLIFAGAEVSRRNMHHDTPLHLAVERNDHVGMVLLLDGKGLHINRPNKDNHSPLSIALYRGFCNLVPTLLKAGADPRQNPHDKQLTLLHVAVEHGDVTCVQALIEEGAKVDSYTDQNCTPLYLAVKLDKIDIAKLLLTNGASVTNVPCKISQVVQSNQMKELLNSLTAP